MAVPEIKLTAFDLKGLAEAIRLALYIGNIGFEDKRVKFDEWKGGVKETIPFGQLPVMEVNGQMVTQSNALLRYAGTLAKIFPAGDPFQAMKVDEMLGIVQDIRMKIGATIYEPDEERKKAMRNKLATETIPVWAEHLEKYFVSAGQSDFTVGKSLTIADLDFLSLMVWVQSGILDGIPKDIFKDYKCIMKIHQNIENQEKIKAYYASKA